MLASLPFFFALCISLHTIFSLPMLPKVWDLERTHQTTRATVVVYSLFRLSAFRVVCGSSSLFFLIRANRVKDRSPAKPHYAHVSPTYFKDQKTPNPLFVKSATRNLLLDELRLLFDMPPSVPDGRWTPLQASPLHCNFCHLFEA